MAAPQIPVDLPVPWLKIFVRFEATSLPTWINAYPQLVALRQIQKYRKLQPILSRLEAFHADYAELVPETTVEEAAAEFNNRGGAYKSKAATNEFRLGEINRMLKRENRAGAQVDVKWKLSDVAVVIDEYRVELTPDVILANAGRARYTPSSNLIGRVAFD